MEPQSSTSAALAGASKDASCNGGATSKSDGVDEAVVSTSGDPVPVQQQGKQLFFNGRASFKQIQQLFGSTCRIQLKKCQYPPTPIIQVSIASPSAEQRPAHSTTVAKVEETSGSTGNDSCSDDEDDEVKFLPTPTSAAATLAKQTRRVTKKKKGGEGVFGRKVTARCTICGKWMTNSYLKVHMRMHTGVKDSRCENCGRSFWSSSTLSKHKKTRDQRNGVCPREIKKYDGEWRPKGSWTCKICWKRMKSGGSYQGHMRSHRGEKPFKCGDCGKGFGRRSMLSEHKRIHTGVWQFSYVFCEKGFHQEQNRFKHLRMHTEETPYFCVVDGCGRSFRHSGSLKSHRRLIHLKKY